MRRVLLAAFLCFVATAALPYWQSRQQVSVGGASANVTVDATGTYLRAGNSSNFNFTGLTISGGLTNSALACALQRGHASNDVTAGVALTWNGVALTQIVSLSRSTNAKVSQLWGLLSPASGTQTLNVSATNLASDNFVDCISFSNVNTTFGSAFISTATATNSQNVAITTTAGHYVMGSMETNNGNNSNPTVLYEDSTNGVVVNGASNYAAGSGSSINLGTSDSQGATVVGTDISN